MNGHNWHIALAGGGTGGHLFPGLAVAEAFRRRAPLARITFVGSGKPLERDAVAAAHYDYLALACRPAPRSPWQTLGFLREHRASVKRAKRFLQDSGVDVVVGLGGYVSAPACAAAAALGLPLILLEQNAQPGRATRWLAPRATQIFLAFDAARVHLKTAASITAIGNPVRAAFCTPRGQQSPDRSARPVLVVLGGSGGSRLLNEQAPRALHKTRDALQNWRIVHQTGADDVDAVQTLYRNFHLDAETHAFIDDMPNLLRRAELAICRGGGATLAELAAVGAPAVIVPWENAADDHQRRNAAVFAERGAARMIDVRDVVGRFDAQLAETVRPLLQNAEQRAAMRRAMQRLARPRAAAQVAEALLQHLPQRQSSAA